MKYIFPIVCTCLLLASCIDSQTSEESPAQQKIPEIINSGETEPPKQESAFEVNVSSVVTRCNSLCKSDQQTYCSVKQEVIFGDNLVTQWDM